MPFEIVIIFEKSIQELQDAIENLTKGTYTFKMALTHINVSHTRNQGRVKSV